VIGSVDITAILTQTTALVAASFLIGIWVWFSGILRTKYPIVWTKDCLLNWRSEDGSPFGRGWIVVISIGNKTNRPISDVDIAFSGTPKEVTLKPNRRFAMHPAGDGCVLAIATVGPKETITLEAHSMQFLDVESVSVGGVSTEQMYPRKFVSKSDLVMPAWVRYVGFLLIYLVFVGISELL
jgi:hypothetical protein